MTKQELRRLEETKVQRYRAAVKKAITEFHQEHQELKGDELLKAFRDSGKAYSEAWNDDEAFNYAYSL